jgi:hypothetical protein
VEIAFTSPQLHCLHMHACMPHARTHLDLCACGIEDGRSDEVVQRRHLQGRGSVRSGTGVGRWEGRRGDGPRAP